MRGVAVFLLLLLIGCAADPHRDVVTSVRGNPVHIKYRRGATSLLTTTRHGTGAGLLLPLELRDEATEMPQGAVLFGNFGERHLVSLSMRWTADDESAASCREQMHEDPAVPFETKASVDRIVEHFTRRVASGLDMLHVVVYFGLDNVCMVVHLSTRAPTPDDLRELETIAAQTRLLKALP